MRQMAERTLSLRYRNLEITCNDTTIFDQREDVEEQEKCMARQQKLSQLLDVSHQNTVREYYLH